MPKTKKEREEYIGKLITNKDKLELRLCVGIPMTGTLRSEWVLARYGQVTPCNWSLVEQIQWLDQYSPLGYTVADARNIIATNCVQSGFEWLLFVDHDTILPPKTLVKLNKYMVDKKYPVVAGLYFIKAVPSEPLIYRGRGTGYYADWKFGDLVDVDAVPMGCTLIHVSILKAMFDEAPEYRIGDLKVRRIFSNPAEMNFDPELMAWKTKVCTEDLEWCTNVIKNRIFDKAGWPEFQEK